jgi:hypothetical protein
MRNESLKERIYHYINGSDKFLNGGEIERLAMDAGYKASNASRRCRELVTEGKIVRMFRREGNSKVASVWYSKILC